MSQEEPRDPMRPGGDQGAPGGAPSAGVGKESGRTPEPLPRFLALLIDAVAAALVGLVPVVGGLAGAAYLLFRDGFDLDFMPRRSFGKKVMKLAVVRDDGQPMDLVTSARRNWPLAFGSLAQFLIFVPVIGWILIPVVIVVGLVFLAIGVYRVLTRDDGRRYGDSFAGTRVVTAAD
jgi:uncharacterized RDD family membrane protein YckC